VNFTADSGVDGFVVDGFVVEGFVGGLVVTVGGSAGGGAA
jgi:hypothetical protein